MNVTGATWLIYVLLFTGAPPYPLPGGVSYLSRHGCLAALAIALEQRHETLVCERIDPPHQLGWLSPRGIMDNPLNFWPTAPDLREWRK